jgi:hypothetical protein
MTRANASPGPASSSRLTIHPRVRSTRQRRGRTTIPLAPWRLGAGDGLRGCGEGSRLTEVMGINRRSIYAADGTRSSRLS